LRNQRRTVNVENEQRKKQNSEKNKNIVVTFDGDFSLVCIEKNIIQQSDKKVFDEKKSDGCAQKKRIAHKAEIVCNRLKKSGITEIVRIKIKKNKINVQTDNAIRKKEV